MRLNLVVGSSDYAFKYSGFRRKQEYFEEKEEDKVPNGVNTNSTTTIKEGGKPAGGNRRRQDQGESVNNKEGRGKPGGRRGGRQGYNDRNKKSGEDKEDNVPSAVITRAPKILGYIPGAELEEEIPISNQPNKNDTHLTLNPSNKETPTLQEIPKQEIIIEVQDIPTEPINTPVEEDKHLIPSPKNDNLITQQQQQETISPDKEKLVEPPHENGSQKTSTPIIEPQSYTFNLSTPLGPELTMGEQTFMEINGSLYLKISPNTTPLPNWYSSLQDDFQNAKNPKSKIQQYQKGKNMKKKL